MKEKRIQFIINMITIINVIIIMILGYHIFINQKYSRTNVRKMLKENASTNKYINTNNYIIEIKDLKTGNLVSRITQNEKARKEENISDGTTRWYINDLNLHTIERNGKKYASKNNEETKNKIILLKDEEISAIPSIDNASFFKYIKHEKYQNKDCIVIVVSDSDTNNYEEDGQKLWIDIENGFVIKEEYNNTWENSYNINGENYSEIKKMQLILECKIETNVVGDNDIEMPNLEGYTFIEEHNNGSIGK